MNWMRLMVVTPLSVIVLQCAWIKLMVISVSVRLLVDIQDNSKLLFQL